MNSTTVGASEEIQLTLYRTLVWNGLPLALRSLSRVFSQKFRQQFKTTLFGRAGAGSASEWSHLKRRYINVCNERMNAMNECKYLISSVCWFTDTKHEPVIGITKVSKCN